MSEKLLKTIEAYLYKEYKDKNENEIDISDYIYLGALFCHAYMLNDLNASDRILENFGRVYLEHILETYKI